MKKIIAFLWFSFLVQYVAAQTAFPDVEQYQLKNGLKVYLIEFGEIPAISVSLFVNCGIRNETPGQQGYSQVAADCINFGCGKYDQTTLENRLFRLGSGISATADENFTTISSSFLNESLDEGLDIFTSAVLHPTFPAEAINQRVSEMIDYGSPVKLDIGEQASIFSRFWIYGSSNPLGRYYYKSQLSKLTPAAIKEFYQFNYTPGNARLVICGKLDKEKLKPMIEKYFGPWTAPFGEVNGASFESPSIKNKQCAFVNRAGATQAAVLYTKIGPEFKSKDVIPFMIANSVFNQVLTKEVREKGGKTYGIYSMYNPYSESRFFEIHTQVREEEMFNTVELTNKTMQDFYNGSITQNQMDDAVKELRNTWLMAEDPESVISFFNPYIFPKPEERKKYLNELSTVTLDDVNKVIKKYFTPDVYRLMIAGDQQKLAEQLKQFPRLKIFNPGEIEVDQ